MRTPEEQEKWRNNFKQANASLALEGMVMDERDLADQEKAITGEWSVDKYLAESLRQAREIGRQRRSKP